ncbi:MAG: hypothetical protein D6737_04940 [Chloroflexi bacterium]|nr:MAG: hypothetical protein D6737_04940 [Chloroflexota bacterium]
MILGVKIAGMRYIASAGRRIYHPYIVAFIVLFCFGIFGRADAQFDDPTLIVRINRGDSSAFYAWDGATLTEVSDLVNDSHNRPGLYAMTESDYVTALVQQTLALRLPLPEAIGGTGTFASDVLWTPDGSHVAQVYWNPSGVPQYTLVIADAESGAGRQIPLDIAPTGLTPSPSLIGIDPVVWSASWLEVNGFPNSVFYDTAGTLLGSSEWLSTGAVRYFTPDGAQFAELPYTDIGRGYRFFEWMRHEGGDYQAALDLTTNEMRLVNPAGQARSINSAGAELYSPVALDPAVVVVESFDFIGARSVWALAPDRSYATLLWTDDVNDSDVELFHSVTISPAGQALAYLQDGEVYIWREGTITQLDAATQLGTVESIYWGPTRWRTRPALDPINLPAAPVTITAETPSPQTTPQLVNAVAPSAATVTPVLTGVTCPGFLPSRVAVGQQARVTPGTPNRLRNGPTTASDTIGTIPGGSIFTVIDGPVCAEGFAWWRINYSGTVGWTAEGGGNEYWIEPFN